MNPCFPFPSLWAVSCLLRQSLELDLQVGSQDWSLQAEIPSAGSAQRFQRIREYLHLFSQK
jgi:hypothetical protein